MMGATEPSRTLESEEQFDPVAIHLDLFHEITNQFE